MKKKNNNLSKYVVYGILPVILIGLVFALSNNENQAQITNILDYNDHLSIPLSFVDKGGSQIDIECKIKQTLTVVDDTGRQIAVVESGGIIASPSFNIVNPQMIDQSQSLL
jgi:hypothetical protein